LARASEARVPARRAGETGKGELGAAACGRKRRAGHALAAAGAFPEISPRGCERGATRNVRAG
jgi:hypothetical protein